jgi:hypothetical protein
MGSLMETVFSTYIGNLRDFVWNFVITVIFMYINLILFLKDLTNEGQGLPDFLAFPPFRDEEVNVFITLIG